MLSPVDNFKVMLANPESRSAASTFSTPVNDPANDTVAVIVFPSIVQHLPESKFTVTGSSLTFKEYFLPSFMKPLQSSDMETI